MSNLEVAVFFLFLLAAVDLIGRFTDGPKMK